MPAEICATTWLPSSPVQDHLLTPQSLERDLLTSVTTLRICDNIEDDDSDGVINVDGGSDDNRRR